jgi:serine/threonine protein kinase
MPDSVGRYRIVRVLGSGAFAAVWLGHDESTGTSVAIKVLSGSLYDDLDVRHRFLEEARILHEADSDRLVRVQDIGELPDGRPYFVMSYADRGTLAERMRKRPLSVRESLAIAEDIAYGVEDVNQLGIIHRDLKPSNVLFQSTPNGGERLLIADLGLAKALAHASGAFTLPVGTPGYMSPEQARFGGGLDVRADVYGLGALTYHLLTGRPPGPPPVDTPPSRLRPELGPDVDQVILRALEMERENRWPTAESFGRALATLRATTVTAPVDSHGTPGPPPPVSAPRQDRPQGPYGPSGTRPVTRGAESPSPDEIPTTPVRDPRSRTDETVVDGVAPGMTPGGTAIYPHPAPGGARGRTTPPQGRPQGGQAHSGGGPRPPAGAHPPGAPPQRAGGAGRRRRLLIPIAIGAGILAVAVGGGLLVGTLLSDDGTDTPRRDPNVVTVSDSSGKLTVTVPRAWSKQPQPTWVPTEVALSDAQPRPVLRATPDFTGFREADGRTPGVFVGLTTDVTPGRLPPPGATRHTQCAKGQPESYRRGTLQGTIIRYTRCTSGTPVISEIGLTDTSGRFGLWIRIKQADNTDLTRRILDSLIVKGP